MAISVKGAGEGNGFLSEMEEAGVQDTYSDMFHFREQDPVWNFHHVVMKKLPPFFKRPKNGGKV